MKHAWVYYRGSWISCCPITTNLQSDLCATGLKTPACKALKAVCSHQQHQKAACTYLTSCNYCLSRSAEGLHAYDTNSVHAQAEPAVFLDKNTKVICQGITGRNGTFHTEQVCCILGYVLHSLACQWHTTTNLCCCKLIITMLPTHRPSNMAQRWSGESTPRRQARRISTCQCLALSRRLSKRQDAQPLPSTFLLQLQVSMPTV